MTYKKIDHALHNEKTCDFLFQNEDHLDWVITTSFYSALHFFEHKLFPLENNGRTYKTFNSYYRSRRRNEGKHNVFIKLVEEKAPLKFATAYKSLFDICRTARYSDYRVAPAIASKAKERLKHIKSYCIKKN